MKGLLVACAVLATFAHFCGSIAGRVAHTFSTDCVTLDVVPDGVPDWHMSQRVFRAPCLGVCPDLEGAE
jgi:hypothetical protein